MCTGNWKSLEIRYIYIYIIFYTLLKNAKHSIYSLGILYNAYCSYIAGNIYLLFNDAVNSRDYIALNDGDITEQ